MNKKHLQRFLLPAVSGILLAFVNLSLVSCSRDIPDNIPEEQVEESTTPTQSTEQKSRSRNVKDLVQKDGAYYNKDGVRTYTVLFGPTFPPFSLRDSDGLIRGFTLDILEGVKKSQNIDFVYDSRPWNGIIKYISGGEFDVLAGSVAINRDLLDEWGVSRPYFKSHIASMSLGENEVDSFDDINDKNLRVAVQKRSNPDEIASQRITNQRNVLHKDTVFLGVKDVVKKDANVVISDTGPLMFYAEKYKEFAPVVKVMPEFGHHYFGFIVKKDRNDELLDKINAGLDDLIDSGEYDRIYRKWLNKEHDPLPSLSEVKKELESRN